MLVKFIVLAWEKMTFRMEHKYAVISSLQTYVIWIKSQGLILFRTNFVWLKRRRQLAIAKLYK